MKTWSGRVQRQGQILSLFDRWDEYAAFMRQLGRQFRGRIEGSPQVPQYTGRTTYTVRTERTTHE
jgi:hypothetical protein